MITITKRFTFEACHNLPHYVGACHNIHGHSYKLDVTITGTIKTCGSEEGMIMDLKELKKLVNELVVNRLDHSNLNDYYDNPTAELMVESIGAQIENALPPSCSLVSVKLWETETGYAEYTTSKHI